MAASKPAAAVEFHSEHASLVLQDERGVWAEFVDGSLTVADAALVARLDKAEGVSRV